MKKRFKKAVVSSLVAVFVLSLIAGLTPLDLVHPVSAASSKKAPIHINNTAGSALSYYQVNLNITYDSDMNNDFSDLRVKNETAGAFVPYWIENKSDGAWCNLWFNATGIPASAWCNDTYYLYYGDAVASSDSNITTTFLFGDDFGPDITTEEVLSVTKSLVATDGESEGRGSQSFRNTISFRGRAIWDYNNSQYTIYVKSDGHIIVGKRALPSGSWSFHDTGLTVSATDAHHAPSIGVDSNGYIHLSPGMHDSALIYRKSNNSEDITGFSVASMIGSNENSATYPYFFKDNNNVLYFHYRNGVSGNGESYLNKYNVTSATWSVLQHPFINTVAAVRNPYVDGFVVDSNNVIHTSFCWREEDQAYNSNVSYAKSGDGGATWNKSDGSSYSIPITYTSSEVIDDTVGGILLNQNDITVDGNNRPHVVYWKNASNGHANYYHTWYNGTSWVVQQVTNYDDSPTTFQFQEKNLARPGIVINTTTNKVHILTRRYYDNYIEVISATAPYTNWDIKKLGIEKWGYQEFAGMIDIDYWKDNGELLLFASRILDGVNPVDIYILKSNLETTENVEIDNYNFNNKWEKTSADSFANVNNSIATIQNDNFFSKDSVMSYGRIVETLIKYDGTTTTKGGMFNTISTTSAFDDSDAQNLYIYASTTEYCHETKNESTTTLNIISEQFPINYEVMGTSLLSGESKAWRKRTLKNTTTNNVPDENMRIGVREWGGGNVYVDWTIVRKYTSPEPTSSLGSEQSTGGGGANASVTVSDGAITFGNLQLSTTKNTVTSGDTQVINTTGASGNQEIEIKLSSSTVAGAINGTILAFVSGSPGQNQLLCQFKGGDVSSYTALTTAYYEFDNSMANNTNANLDIQLTMPSSVSNNNYYDDYQFEITVRATLL